MSESQQTPQQQQFHQHHLQQQQHSPTLCDRFPISGRISPNNNNNSTIDNNNLTSSPSSFGLPTATSQSSALIPPYSNSTPFQNRSTTYPSNGSAISHKHIAEHPRTSTTTTFTPKNLQRGSLSSPTKVMSPEDAPTTSPMAGEEGPSSTPNTSSGASSPSNTFNLTCMTCHTHFTSAELYARHDCVNSNTSGGDASESSTTLGHNSSGEPMDLNRSGSIGNDSGINQSESEPLIQENSSDVERFDGKIVYNPDGSAYIFDSEMSEDDAVGLDLHHQEGSIVDSPTHPLPETGVPSIPPIANAFYVTKNTRAFYNALYGHTLSSLLPEKKGSEVPIVHSYRVISVGDKDRETECKDHDKADGIKDDSFRSEKSDKSKVPFLDYTQVPIKPILMCFVCKLSFGYVRSFIGHAMGDHSVVLSDQEKDLLAKKNVSAILQVAGREKDPRISFLEPVSPPGSNNGPGQADPPPSRAPSGSSPRQQTEKETIQSNQTNQNSPRDLHKSEASNPSDDDQPEPMETETPSLCVKREMDLFEPTSRSIHHSQPPHLTLPLHLQQFHPNHHNLHLPPPSPPFATPQHPAGMRTPDMSRKSPISALGSNGGRSSLSPVTSMSPTSFSPLPSPITQLTGTIIGACPEHMSGRQQGISCDKCDMILQQSRQLSGQMAFMHSRNSCKTLKCPKCNWHYKYQETLEIHMKEKHPDNESTCIYCLTSQPHPRLARGETYTCGYKPYRCEVCNYSTTTKGNLSIHMQSDKHLNNMQELQNGGIPNMESGVVTPQSQILAQCSQPSPSSSNCAPKVSTPSSTSITPPSHQKPKPMWRCDVCNYETNVARNLRIHMTSEKHTHNMMVLQQNVKHMQQLSALPDPMALLQLSQSGMLHDKPPPPPEVAMADLAYNQALLIQMISGGGPMGANLSGNLLGGPNPADHMGPHFDLGINPEALEPPPEPVPPNPRAVYTCCVCSNFNTDSLEQLNIHLQFDRSKLNENEVLLIVAGNYICKLCSYKTNLKANFQLHCKTDKHLQKLQYVNHILEGGPRNEWKLKYLANTNPLHVRCNLCEFYTNSVHKLQLHSAHQRHEVLAMLFKHLSSPDHPVPLDRRQFRCCLCNFTTKARLELLHHIRSVRHLQMEQIHQLQRHAEGKGGTHQDIGDIFRVEEEEDLNNSRDDVKTEATSNHSCPVCSFCTSEGEDRLQAHMDLMHPDRRSGSGGGSHKNDFSRELEDHSPPERRSLAGRGDLFNDRREKHKESSKDLDGMSCPLCEETCFDMASLEKHAIDVHSVNSDGLQRLLLLVRLSNAAKKEAAASHNNNNSIFGDGSNSEGGGEEVNHHGNSGRGGNCGGSPSTSIGSPMANASRSMVSPCQSSADCDRDFKEENRHGQDGGGDRERDDRERSVTPAARHGTPTPGRGTPTPRAASTPGVTSPSSAGGETTPTTSTSVGGNLNPQMAEMAAAINALTAAQMQHQMPFNPMMLAGLGLAGLPLHLNPLAAMNLQPPLAPGLPHPMFDPVALANMAASQSNNSQGHQNDFFLKQQQQQHIMQHQQQQQQQQAAAAAAAAAAQQKRGRTRITDEQLKILRAHFDINNSPSEDQITDMAGQSGLPPKVIKHWFRNTLFKERQRCKDSPYNFSIPPSTTLNLEEYEKTGETKVIPMNPEDAREIMEMNRSRDHDDRERSSERSKVPTPEVTVESHLHQPKVSNVNQDSSRLQEKSEDNSNARGNSSGMGGCADSVTENRGNNSQHHQHQQLLSQQPHPHLLPQSSPLPQSGVSAPHLVSSASCSPVGSVSSATFPTTFPPMSSPQTSLSLSSLISNQLESNSMLGHKMPQTPPQVPTSGLNHPSAGLSPTPSNLSYPTTPPGNNSSGKRANRTRFTDYQIKVLQEFFENNAYPKDDDLEYLSKLLSLSPRVIVVWFQNARQKARKVYENQPPIDPMEENAGRFTRTPGLNYQCKKCLLVFQRYYELIRHQKTHCFKEEDAKRSAQAQAAAAQAAAMYHDDNSSHSSITENSSQSRDMDNSKVMEDTFQCDKCSLVFNRFEQWREHQIVHLMNPALFMNKGTESPFPPLSQLPQHSPQSSTSLTQSTPPPPPPPQQTLSQFQQHQQQHQQQLPSPLLPPASPLKRKAEESEDEQSIGGEQQRDKRLRTTILPEQLDYLYQKYQMEANPSRKMLETIAHEVGLKKRVVQVWFQNTRARERKGQFRAHAQVINKKCPFCPAIFKVKSALESHLSTKHSDQFSSGEINIDALPDLDDHYGFGNFGGLSSSNHCSPPPPPPHPPSMTQAPSLTMPSLFSPSERPEDTLAKYHEEAIRRYLTDVSLANNNNNSNNQQTQQENPNNSQTSHGGGGGLGGGGVRGLGLNGGAPPVVGLSGYRREGERPLDLSRPLELARSLAVNFIGVNNPASNFDNYSSSASENKGDNFAAKNAEKMNEKMYGTDSLLSDDEYYQMDVPDGDDNDLGNSYESNPTSPASSTTGSTKQSSSLGTSAKRFRTQMTSTQVKLMKSVFVDYKTPTMAECEMFGREIQLPKRVIQVWFQNARAKEKKAKIALMKIIGQEPEGAKPASDCKVCGFEYNSKYSIQDHLFTRAHIDNMRAHIEKQKEESDQITLANSVSSTSSGMNSANNSIPPHGLSHPSFTNTGNDEVNSNYNQFGSQFPPNNLQLHMAHLMALNSQSNHGMNDNQNLKQHCPPLANLGSNPSLNGDIGNSFNRDRSNGLPLLGSTESSSSCGSEVNMIGTHNAGTAANSSSLQIGSTKTPLPASSGGSSACEILTSSLGSGHGGKLPLIPDRSTDQNQGNSIGSTTVGGGGVGDDMNRLQLLHQVYQQMGINGNLQSSANNPQQQQQHPLLQQPMIEG